MRYTRRMTRAERIAALQAELAKLQARPAEPAMADPPPVIGFQYTFNGSQFSGVAIRAGDLWHASVTTPDVSLPPMDWDDLLDRLEQNQAGALYKASWSQL